jgi:hypothetical protein
VAGDRSSKPAAVGRLGNPLALSDSETFDVADKAMTGNDFAAARARKTISGPNNGWFWRAFELRNDSTDFKNFRWL